MPAEFRSPDWDSYRMDMHDPHRELEPLEREVRIVDQALEHLVGIVPGVRDDSRCIPGAGGSQLRYPVDSHH
ncbi:MAG TPA: hypothetical protein PKN69_00715, partial [Candidatus Latescibacteria bacterium]|nr:hypothetical protein [Candidatus Latescibacterota bacterium]